MLSRFSITLDYLNASLSSTNTAFCTTILQLKFVIMIIMVMIIWRRVAGDDLPRGAHDLGPGSLEGAPPQQPGQQQQQQRPPPAPAPAPPPPSSSPAPPPQSQQQQQQRQQPQQRPGERPAFCSCRLFVFICIDPRTWNIGILFEIVWHE